MRYPFFTILILVPIFYSCDQQEEDILPDLSKYDIVFKMGSVCGWCAGSDSMTITSEKVYYQNNAPCDDEVFKTESDMNVDDWNELTELLDFDEFQEIDLNTCNVCVDGCDTWVYIRTDTLSHQIRYGYRDSLILFEIQPLLDKLNSVRSTMAAKENY